MFGLRLLDRCVFSVIHLVVMQSPASVAGSLKQLAFLLLFNIPKAFLAIVIPS
jgi:hypothetical protein